MNVTSRTVGHTHLAGATGGVMCRRRDRVGTFMGRDDGYRGGTNNNGGSNSSSNNGARAPWPLARPTTLRGGCAGGGGGGGDNHISPMLRPRKGQGFSHSVTPSPTFSAQQGVSKKTKGIRCTSYDRGPLHAFWGGSMLSPSAEIDDY